jgi:hypothetical protein
MLASACFPGTILGSWQVIQKPKIPLGQNSAFELPEKKRKEKKGRQHDKTPLNFLFTFEK